MSRIQLLLLLWTFVGKSPFFVRAQQQIFARDTNPPPPVGRQASNSRPVFGTQDGYDVGGSEPLCWTSLYNASFTEDNNHTFTNHLQAMQEFMFEYAANDQKGVSLLPSCLNGTFFSMTPLKLEPAIGRKGNSDAAAHAEMYTDSPYVFRLNIEMDLALLLGPTAQVVATNSTNQTFGIYCRIHVCHAELQGFCNPLKDTRDLDDSLTKAETDVGATTEFANDDTKYKYVPGTPLLGIVSNSMGPTASSNRMAVFSRWIQWKLRDTNQTGVYKAQVDMTLQLPNTIPSGPYFIVGHVIVDVPTADTTTSTSTSDNNEFLRLDMSQTIPNKVVFVREEPTVYTVTDQAKIWLAVVIALVGGFALYCLGFVYSTRNTSVMKLAQGGLLGALVASCLLQVVSTAFFLPVNDIFCRLSGPMVHVPLHFCGAILVGRVWRIYCTLGIANSLGKGPASKSTSGCLWPERVIVSCLDSMAGLFSCWGLSKHLPGGTSPRGDLRRSVGFRRIVTPRETLSVIVFLTIPQIVYQVVASVFFRGGLETQFDTSGDVGRVICETDGAWVNMTGTAIAAAVYCLAVCMAWISRDLPSAFNEKDQIFTAATIATILAVMALALEQITNHASTEPDVSVFLSSSLSIGISASMLLLIVWPKVRRLRSGEKVVVSSLLGARYSVAKTPTSATDSTGTAPHRPISVSSTNSVATTPVFINAKRIHVRPDDPIPSHIETGVVSVQGILRNVTKQSDDGRPLSKDDWIEMRSEVAKLKADLDLVDLEPAESVFLIESLVDV